MNFSFLDLAIYQTSGVSSVTPPAPSILFDWRPTTENLGWAASPLTNSTWTDYQNHPNKDNATIIDFDAPTTYGVTSITGSHLLPLIQTIVLSGNAGITSLPPFQTASLTQFTASGCTGLTTLPDMSASVLQELNCHGCTGLTNVGSSSFSPTMRAVRFSSCTNLKSLPTIPSSLEWLNLNNVGTSLTSSLVGMSNSMSFIDITVCPGIPSSSTVFPDSIAEFTASGMLWPPPFGNGWNGPPVLPKSASIYMTDCYLFTPGTLQQLYLQLVNNGKFSGSANTFGCETFGGPINGTTQGYIDTLRARGWTVITDTY